MRFSPRVESLKGTGAAAWRIHFEAAEAKAAGRDVILMSIGDPDLDTPTPVIERAIEGLRSGVTHYTDLRGIAPLRKAVADRFRARSGCDVGPDNVVIVAGTQNGLFSAAQLLYGPGDEVILLDPAYATYEATIRASGADTVRVPCRQDRLLRPDLAAIAAAVTPRTRGILINNPANPSGVALHEDELAGLAAIAERHDLTVIADEVYGALTFERPHISFASLPGMLERTVTVSSLSKSHAMTGWRVGWAIGPVAFAEHGERLSLAMLYGVASFTQTAAITAIEEADTIEADMVAIYRRRCALVADALDGVAGLNVVRPEGGMFVMVDVSATGLAAIDFAWRLYREVGVCVLDGAAFGPSAAQAVRVSCAIGDRDLEEGCRRIAAFAARLAATAA